MTIAVFKVILVKMRNPSNSSPILKKTDI